MPPCGIMEHLWKSCSGLHSIDVLSLRTKMLSMHEDSTGILKYINTLEDAKKRSECADSTHAWELLGGEQGLNSNKHQIVLGERVSRISAL